MPARSTGRRTETRDVRRSWAPDPGVIPRNPIGPGSVAVELGGPAARESEDVAAVRFGVAAQLVRWKLFAEVPAVDDDDEVRCRKWLT